MSSSKRRNPLGLILPPTVNESEKEDGNQEESNTTISLDEQLKRLGLTEPQKQRLNEWMQVKDSIQSDLSEDALENLGELGKGNGGVVHRVMHKKKGVTMARKLVHLEVKPSIRQQIIKELSVLHKCNSPYIVGFYGAFLDNSDISICMEYMDGLSLDIVLKKVGRLSEPYVGRIAVAVVRGLTYLKEELKILHRDVKPSNMLVNSSGEIKLCDFGVSGMLTDSMANSFVGTRSYMAPERLQGSHYSIHSDIWSFGLSLVELLIGRYPVPTPSKAEYAVIFGKTESEIKFAEELDPTENDGNITTPAAMAIFEMLDYIVNRPPPTLPLEIFSDKLVYFVGRCLRKMPGDRPNLKALSMDPFLQDYEKADDNEMASGNKVPEQMVTLTPVVKTPLTDTFNVPLSQQGRPCGFFEAQFYKCMEAYGAKLGRKYCDLEHRDFQECMTSDKQQKRAKAIGDQRRKLYAEGKIDKAMLDDHPAPGEFKSDYFSWQRIN